MGGVKIKFIMESYFNNEQNINLGSCIISINHNGNPIMYSNIVNYY